MNVFLDSLIRFIAKESILQPNRVKITEAGPRNPGKFTPRLQQNPIECWIFRKGIPIRSGLRIFAFYFLIDLTIQKMRIQRNAV